MKDLVEKRHPVVDCICRSDGAIFVPKSKRYGEAHWTYGSQSAQGYMQVSIHGKILKAHRLIAQVFVPGEAPDLIVDHIDRDRTNNVPENLRWVTQKENVHNSERYDRCSYGVHGDSRENKIEYAKAWNKAHPEAKREHDRSYYERNRPEILKRARERYALKKQN